MKRSDASAIFIVLVVLTGFSLLLTGWWQTVGLTNDLILVRQRAINRFYRTEVLLNYGIAWAKKNFDKILAELKKTGRSEIIDGGTVMLEPGVVGKGAIVFDCLPRPAIHAKGGSVIRVAAMISIGSAVPVNLVAEKAGTMQGLRHQCLLEREAINGSGKKEFRFVVHHFSFSTDC